MLPILVGLVAIVCAFAAQVADRRASPSSCSSVESATYRVTSLVVPRERPDVQRLEDLPADASYPVGPHRRVDRGLRRPRAAAHLALPQPRARGSPPGSLAILLPVFVALSRMYRGMHHPLDVAGGVVVGIGALLVLLFACRAAGVARGAHASAPARGRARSRSAPVA